MTQNQLQYWSLEEQKRHNRVGERQRALEIGLGTLANVAGTAIGSLTKIGNTAQAVKGNLANTRLKHQLINQGVK